MGIFPFSEEIPEDFTKNLSIWVTVRQNRQEIHSVSNNFTANKNMKHINDSEWSTLCPLFSLCTNENAL